MASTDEPISVPHKADKAKKLEALLGPLSSSWGNSMASNKFDDFQLTLFDLISNASETGIQQCFNQKLTDIYKFILTLFIASLHKDNPLRLANESKLLPSPPKSKSAQNNNNNKKPGDNPLNSILVTPSTTLPRPPKRKKSEAKEEPKPEPPPEEQPSDPNKNNNVTGIGDTDFLQRGLSDIDELKEKDKYILEQEAKRKQREKEKENTLSNSNGITPHASDDKLAQLITQNSTRNKNFFDDILLTDNDQTDNEFSKTYESYNGDVFFAQRTLTTREHTTTEKFKCNPKEKAIVDEWRVLLHGLRVSDNNKGITPTPQPQDQQQQMEELMPPTDEIEDDDAVIVQSGMFLQNEMKCF